MKNPINYSLGLISAALCLVSAVSYNASAAVLYWDPNGTTSVGGNGTWDATTKLWSTASTQSATASLVAWVPADAANFCAGPTNAQGTFTITLNSALGTGGIFNGSLTPGGSTVTISGTGSLTLGSGASGFSTSVAKNANTSTTIAVPITGVGPLEPESSGPLHLSAVNTYTGGTIFDQTGIVFFNNSSSFGTGTMSMAAGGGAIVYEGSNPVNITNKFTPGNFNMNIVGSPSGVTFSGPWVITNSALGSGGSGNLVIVAGVLSGNGTFIKYNGSTMELAGTNTYTGAIIISNNILGGTLSLGPNGSINTASSLTIQSGTIFDVSAINAYTLGSSTTLKASGVGILTNNGSTIVGAASGTVSFGVRPLILNITPTSFTGDNAHPPLYISQGALTLNNNAITITNAAATVLGAGVYRLIQVGDGATGTINGTVNGSVPVSVFTTAGATGLAAGMGAFLQIANGDVNLVVTTAPTFSNLAASQSSVYDNNAITLSGTVSASSGTVFPAMGEPVSASINGNVQSTTINDATGDFSFTYNPSTIPSKTAAYAITYSYGGNGTLSPATDASTALTVTQAPLTITAVNASKSYGQKATFPLTGFTSSTLYNSDSITSVTNTSTGAATNVFPGTYPIVPTGAAGKGLTNYTITFVNGTLTVGPATLNVTAVNVSRPYGATNPPLTYTNTGFVNNETLATSDVAGTPVLGTGADTNNDLGVYPITVSLGTLTSTNYTFNLLAGSLIVTNAVATNKITSSANPALPAADVTFTATLSAIGSTAIPAGSVQFLIDGNAYGPPVVLDTNGVATTDSATLSHGNHTIEVDYAGSTNSSGLTNIIGATNTLTQLIDQPPVAGPATYARSSGAGLNIKVSDLLTNASDPDGDAISLLSVSATSANGGSVIDTNGFVSYGPPAANGNVTDTFTYTVADSFGVTNSGTVTVTIQADGNNPSPNITDVGMMPDGTATIGFAGIPGRTYLIQAATNMTSPITWTTIGTNTVGSTGLFQFNDTDSTNFPNRFYRTTTP